LADLHDWGYLSSLDEILTWHYELPFERVHADPPLSVEDARWLSGKRERRLKFVERVKAAREVINRVEDCASIVRENRYRGANSQRQSRTTTGYSLDGSYSLLFRSVGMLLMPP